MMDEKRDIGATNIEGTPSSFKNGNPTGAKTYEPGIFDEQAAAEPEPILSDQSEQGIAQTGEEDPLWGIEDPEVAAAVRELNHNQKSGPVQTEATSYWEQCDTSHIASSKTATASFDSGFAPIGATDGESVLAWGQNNSPPRTAIAALRSLVAALSDSVKA